MTKRRILALLATICLSSLVGCSSPREAEDTNLRQIVVRFQHLKALGEIPGLGPEESGELSVFRVKSRQRTSESFRRFTTRVEGCSNLYLVDVASKGKQLRCFFCKDSSPPVLIATYRHEINDWIEQLAK